MEKQYWRIITCRSSINDDKELMDNTQILIGKWGKIVSGQNAGRYVFVQEDPQETGGFFIFQCREPSIKTGFDNWAENIESVQNFFQHSGWKIVWLDQGKIENSVV